MRPNLARATLKNGGQILNAWCSIGSSHIAEALSHQGFDSITIDLQHGAIDDAQAFQMLQAISTTNATPFVRVAWNDPASLMKVLDAGAYGVICPMINTADDAKAFVGACRYPPLGWRSYGPNRAVYYAGADYWQHANHEVLLFAQVETAEAVANIDAILDIDGLDGIYVGPGDLSLSMGAPPLMAPKDSTVLAAMAEVLAKTKAKGLFPAVHTDGPATAIKRYQEGFLFCSLQTDMRMLVNAAKAAVDAVKSTKQT